MPEIIADRAAGISEDTAFIFCCWPSAGRGSANSLIVRELPHSLHSVEDKRDLQYISF
jgi:hypothetical protein